LNGGHSCVYNSDIVL